MYTIEVLLKGNPAPMGVIRKEEEDAKQVYQQVLAAVQKGEPSILELTCERTNRQVFILTQEITAAQLTPKAGSTSPLGSRPGFAAALEGA